MIILHTQDGTSPDHSATSGATIKHVRKSPSGGSKVHWGSHEYVAIAPGASEETTTLPQSLPVGGGGSGHMPARGERMRVNL